VISLYSIPQFFPKQSTVRCSEPLIGLLKLPLSSWLLLTTAILKKNVTCICLAGDEDILDRVANLKGTLEVQSSAIQEIIEEAGLFKKKALIEKLSSHLASLQQRLSPDSIDAQLSKKKR